MNLYHVIFLNANFLTLRGIRTNKMLIFFKFLRHQLFKTKETLVQITNHMICLFHVL